MTGALNRITRDQNRAAWVAWHTAYLTAYAPVKSREFTPLKRLIVADRSPVERSDWETTFDAFSAWADGRGKVKKD